MQNALAQAIGYAVQHRVQRDQHVPGLRRAERGGAVRAAGRAEPRRRGRRLIRATPANSVGARAQRPGPVLVPGRLPRGARRGGGGPRAARPRASPATTCRCRWRRPGSTCPRRARDGQYWLVSGTSPACALTAGVAALIKSRYPRLAPALVVRAITSSAQHRPRGGYDDKVGFGTVDAAAALTAAGRLAGHLRPAAGPPAGTALRRGQRGRPPVPVRPARGRPGWSPPAWPALGCLALTADSRRRAWPGCAGPVSRGQQPPRPRRLAGPRMLPAWPGRARVQDQLGRDRRMATATAGDPVGGLTPAGDPGARLPDFASRVLDWPTRSRRAG